MIVRRCIKGREEVVSTGIRVSIAVAAAFGLAVGIPVGGRGVYDTFVNGIYSGLIEELIVGAGFLFFYLINYYPRPLYPVSAYSPIQAHPSSKRQTTVTV